MRWIIWAFAAGCIGNAEVGSIEQSLLPPGNQRVFGAYTADYFGDSGGGITVQRFETDVHKTLAIEPRHLIIVDRAHPPAFAGEVRNWADDVRRRGRTPLIVWNLFSNNGLDGQEVLCSDPDYPELKEEFSARAIRNGYLDTYI